MWKNQGSWNFFHTKLIPNSSKYITTDGDGKWILDIDVCDYRGLGRFVLGLFRDIDIVEGDDFRAYMRKEIDALAEKNV